MISFSNTNLPSSRSTPPARPKVPRCGSFRMRSRSSGVWPPNKPSHRSQNPSRCKAPVSPTQTSNTKKAPSIGEAKYVSKTVQPPRTPPSRSPTTGNQNRERATTVGEGLSRKRIGTIVNKASAVRKLCMSQSPQSVVLLPRTSGWHAFAARHSHRFRPWSGGPRKHGTRHQLNKSSMQRCWSVIRDPFLRITWFSSVAAFADAIPDRRAGESRSASARACWNRCRA